MTDLTEDTPPAEDTRRKQVAAAVIAVLMLVLAALLAFVLLADDDEQQVTTTTAGVTTTTTEAATTTTTEDDTPETSTTTTAAAAAPIEVDASTAVFPFADSGQRFHEPVAAVVAFAETYIGFVDPLYSEFRQGDPRSGEVVVRPTEDGPETTVLVRQLEDASWWIIGAVTDNIVLGQPEPLDVLSSPVALRGQAWAFEGNVETAIWTDGADDPLAQGFVTGGGDQMRPFDGELTYDQQPSTRYGALLLVTRNAENGNVWEAAVVRVAF